MDSLPAAFKIAAMIRPLALVLIILSCTLSTAAADPQATTKPWIGVHIAAGNQATLEKIRQRIPALAQVGVNTLILEINYGYQFESRPEMKARDGITKAQAREVAALARENGIRLVPCLNCLGHQSWAKRTGSLLTHHPELDETPGKYPENQGIYCRSWCPLNPHTPEVVFPLIDELIDAFGADAFHVGMDEVFLIGTDDCPLCKGKDPGELFAKQVNDLHEHLVKQKKVEMLMWADRLLDAKALGYSKWEASTNGTFTAVDRIPRDIVMCDWHYEKQAEYKSVPFLLDKGFRVWPAGWHKIEAVEALIDYSLAQKNPRMIGYLSTTWGKVKPEEVDAFEPTKVGVRKLRETPAR
jgi:hypothetical protein